MCDKKNKQSEKITNHQMMLMKGQSVPLLGYHVLRDYVLPAINGEHQSSILYWAGRNLAHQFTLESFEECIHLFLELGWGLLEISQSSNHVKTFHLKSPYFHPRDIHQNKSTYALECGFLAQTIAHIEEKDTEGDFKVISKSQESYIEFQIYVQKKEKSAVGRE